MLCRRFISPVTDLSLVSNKAVLIFYTPFLAIQWHAGFNINDPCECDTRRVFNVSKAARFVNVLDIRIGITF